MQGGWVDRLRGAVAREPFGAEGLSGAPLERVTLADGSVVITKLLSAELDWVMRVTRDRGRVHAIWDAGLFRRMPSRVDHAMLGVEPVNGGWLVVMPDVSADLVDPEGVITQAQIETLFAALHEMHTSFAGVPVPGACTFAQRAALYAPDLGAREPDSPLASLNPMVRESFVENGVPRHVDLVTRLRADSSGLDAQMASCARTFVHGDVWAVNLGFRGDGIVLLDWSIAMHAPGALDITTFLALTDIGVGGAYEGDQDSVLDLYRSACGADHDERALQLCLIAAFCLFGPAISFREEAFAWWSAAFDRALEVWSP